MQGRGQAVHEQQAPALRRAAVAATLPATLPTRSLVADARSLGLPLLCKMGDEGARRQGSATQPKPQALSPSLVVAGTFGTAITLR